MDGHNNKKRLAGCDAGEAFWFSYSCYANVPRLDEVFAVGGDAGLRDGVFAFGVGYQRGGAADG